jgi:hypothetical protein
MCQPVALATSYNLQGLAIDTTNVYWTNSNEAR